MGWDNSHMHAFKFGKIPYAGTQTVEDCGPPIRHEDSMTLAALIKRKELDWQIRSGGGQLETGVKLLRI